MKKMKLAKTVSYPLLLLFLGACETNLSASGSQVRDMTGQDISNCSFIRVVEGSEMLGWSTAGDKRSALNKLRNEVAKAGGNALARGLLDLTGKGDRARQVNPGLYGKSGPNLTGEIVQGIRSREPRGMSNIPPAEGMVNNPNYGKPGTVQPKATPTPPTPTPAPPVPKLTTAQQAVNTQYDELRKSNPAKAVEYGLRMARAGASKRSFTMPK